MQFITRRLNYQGSKMPIIAMLYMQRHLAGLNMNRIKNNVPLLE